MAKFFFEITMSLDGFVAGPDATLEEPLGKGGEQLHEWVYPLASWREPHGLEGGETGPDDDVMRETLARAGSVIMGRRMFSGGEGPWAADPNADAWWGDDPPFHTAVFVLTHHEREPVVKEGGTTFHFVTDGIESALRQAREVAGDLDIRLGGGAATVRAYLRAGLVDEIHVPVVPILLGAGERLFDGLTGYECVDLVASPRVAHVRMVRSAR
jgi:dihydrofolate reductase